MKKVFLTGSLLVIAMFAVIYFAGSPKPQGIRVRKQPTAPKSAPMRNLRQQLETAASVCQADCAKLVADFERELPEMVAPDFRKARRNVPAVVDQFSGFKVGTKLCYKIAKDRIRKTHDFQDACSAALDKPIIQPCLHANAVASDALATLQLRLRERQMRYSAEVAALCKESNAVNAPSEADLEQLENALSTFQSSVVENTMKQAGAALGTAFEVIFIRESCSYIAKLFAKPVAKICGSATAAGICAAADGPLPIGDIVGGVISVVSLGWTAYDIYDVTCVMPKRLKKELNSGIDGAEQKLREQKLSQARQLGKLYQESTAELYAKLSQQL